MDGSPMPGILVEMLRGISGTRTAFLRRLYVANESEGEEEKGRVYAEVYTMDGRYLPGVPVAGRGGSPKAFAWEPMPTPDPNAESRTEDDTGTTQVLLQNRQRQQPMVVGSIQHPKLGIVGKTPEVDQDADHSGDVAVTDFGWVLNDARVILDSRGGFTIITGGTSPNARIQLPAGAVLRVSRDGDASERLVLSGPLVDYLQELADKVNGLTTHVNQLTLLLSAAVGGHVPAGLPSNVLIPIADPVKAQLQSATIHVSDDSEAS